MKKRVSIRAQPKPRNRPMPKSESAAILSEYVTAIREGKEPPADVTEYVLWGIERNLKGLKPWPTIPGAKRIDTEKLFWAIQIFQAAETPYPQMVKNLAAAFDVEEKTIKKSIDRLFEEDDPSIFT